MSKKSRKKSSSKRNGQDRGRRGVPCRTHVVPMPGARALMDRMDNHERCLFQTTLLTLIGAEDVAIAIHDYGGYQAVVNFGETELVVQYVGRHVMENGHVPEPVFVLDEYDRRQPGQTQPPLWLGDFRPLLRTTSLDGLKSRA